MGRRKKRKFSSDFKAKVALEALKERKTLNELAQKYDLQSMQISKWKKELKEKMSLVFETPSNKDEEEKEQEQARLYEEIGRLSIKIDWLKKKWSPSIHEKRLLVEPGHSELSIVEQCSLLGLVRSSYYHKPAIESELNLELMRLIDEQYMHQPSWGGPRMTAWLNNRHGFQVNKKRMARLMKLMGIRGIVPSMKVRTSLQNSKHQVFPYLLKGKQIVRANEVWASDITYIPMERGFMYLVAIFDLHSRYVVSREFDNSLETSFCLEAFEETLSLGRPEIFNTEKGTLYTSSVFVEKLLSEGIQPSMTDSGRCWDNIRMERLWWSVKYEDVYFKEYPTVPSLVRGLGSYFDQYNEERPHEALGCKIPRQVFYDA